METFETLDEARNEGATSEQEAAMLNALSEVQFALNRLRGIIDSNLSLLEDSVREVRTARHIAADSNRLARRRIIREGGFPRLMVTSK